MAATTPFDWKSLITPAVTLGMKAIGDKVAPDPSLINANTNAQQAKVSDAQNAFNNSQTQFNDQLALQKIARAQQIRQNTLPGMYTTLGFSPEQGKQMAASSAPTAGTAPGAPGIPNTAPSVPSIPSAPAAVSKPSLGSTIAKTAGGVGLSLAPAIIGGLMHGGAAAAAGTAAAGTAGTAGTAGGLTALGATGIGAAVAAPIIAGLIWKKSQVHPVADKWVQGQQAPFDAAWQKIEQSGMPPDQQQAAKQQSAQNYLNALAQFAGEGGKNMQVAKQAAATFRQYYGDPMKYGIQLPF